MTSLPSVWYVIHSKPRQEDIALAQLQRQEFEVYLPLFRVFAKPRPAARARARQAGAPDADAAVQAIRRAEAWRNQAPLDAISPYAPGMTVCLLDPAFTGLQALVRSVSRDRVTLLLDILGRPQQVQVEFARIAPC